MIESSFWLRSATTEEEKQRKVMEDMKRRHATLEKEIAALKKRPPTKPGLNLTGKDDKGKGKGKGKGGYGAWETQKGPRADPYKESPFLQKDPDTGKEYCRKKNRNIPCDETKCSHLHWCSWLHCPDRKTCPGAYKHKKFA